MTVPQTNGNGIWPRVLLALLVPVLAGLIAWGTIRSDVANLKAAVDSKASREVVQAQYEAILRELQDIKRRLP